MIPVFKPSMGDEEVNAVAEVIRSGWIGLGPRTQAFEEKFAAFIGTKYAVGLNSATAALHLALLVADPKAGEVITTPMTFVSTNHAIMYNKAVPVFCDIEPDTLNIDAGKIEPLITERTRAIVVVHYGGYACDMDNIVSIANKHGLKVIEDAAHGCGGEYKNRKLGSIGDLGVFSFHAVKNLATGDGGMITTNDREIFERLKKLRWLGITKDTFSREEKDSQRYSWYYNVEEIGFKYHMNDIQAALGLVQLAKLDRTNGRRGEIVDRYNKGFATIPWIERPVRKGYMTKPAYHNYVIKCGCRDELNDHLKHKGISSGVHYVPSNHYEMYQACTGETPVSRGVWQRLLTLPLYPDLSDREVDHIIETVSGFPGH